MKNIINFINESMIDKNIINETCKKWQNNLADKFDDLSDWSFNDDNIHDFMAKNKINNVDALWVFDVIDTFIEYATGEIEWNFWDFNGSEDEIWEKLWGEDFINFMANDKGYGNPKIIEKIIKAMPDVLNEFADKNKDISNLTIDEIFEYLKKYKIPAKIDSYRENIIIFNPKNYPNGYSSPYSIHVGYKKQPNYSRAMSASSNFDNEYIYLSVTDSFKPETDNKKIFKRLLNLSGMTEATNGRHAQWGSYKFAIETEKHLIYICELLKKHIRKI